MRPIDILRTKLTSEVFSDSDAHLVLGVGAAYHGKITRLLDSGALLKIRRGLYAFGEPFRRRPINSFLLANTVYGPSYVSLESALSYYGLIPEAVKQVTSVTLKRPKVATTPLGVFSYRTIRSCAFPFGTTSIHIDSSNLIIATPEKAILDKLYLDFTGETVQEFLTESLRIEEHDLAKLNLLFLKELSQTYDQKSLHAKVLSFVTAMRELP